MNDMSHLDSLVSGDLHEAPIFLCFGYAGLKKLPELDRQEQFRNLMRAAAPGVMVFANANAGKRSRLQARREGIVSGVFDMTVPWARGRVAYVEVKGFDASGRPGKLSQQQIDWGNAMHRLGFDVMCCFDPFHALDWLRGLGCPIRDVR